MLTELFSEARSVLQERVDRLKRRAVALVAAGLLLTLAFLFALLAAFAELQRHFGPALAALILFAVLLAAGLLTLMIGRERKSAAEAKRQLQKTAVSFQRSVEEAPLTSSGWPLILTAFAAGLALSRGRFNGRRRAGR